MRISRRAAPPGLPDTRSPEPAASRGQPAPGLIFLTGKSSARRIPEGKSLWKDNAGEPANGIRTGRQSVPRFHPGGATQTRLDMQEGGTGLMIRRQHEKGR